MTEFDSLMQESFEALLEVAGETREIVISDGRGGEKKLALQVIWSVDALSRPTITKIAGVFLGDVLLSVRETDLDRRPISGEFLYSPAGTQWEILGVMTSNDVHYLTLQAIRAA